MKIGETIVTNMCIGDKSISAAYLGEVLVYTPPLGELLFNTELYNSAGFQTINTDFTGTQICNAYNQIAMWTASGPTNGATRAITFNRGYLGGKLLSGKRYKFDIQFGSGNITGGDMMIMIGSPLADPFVGSFGQIIDSIGAGDTIKSYRIIGGFMQVTIEFTAVRNSAENDCIVFVSNALYGTINITKPSLIKILP